MKKLRADEIQGMLSIIGRAHSTNEREEKFIKNFGIRIVII
jgi:hypothetical protein